MRGSKVGARNRASTKRLLNSGCVITEEVVSKRADGKSLAKVLGGDLTPDIKKAPFPRPSQ
jgi:hypothetical protein